MAEFWGRRPLYLRGSRNKFDFVFDEARLDRLLASAEHGESPLLVRASFDRGDDARKERQFRIHPSQAKALFAAGATLCVTGIEQADLGLQRFAQAVKSELNYPGPVMVNCYHSPAGAGFGLHYDARVATTLQLAGKKTWRFGLAPHLAWPDRDALHDPELHGRVGARAQGQASSATLRTVTLSPGDLLMLPAGTWHAASAAGGPSLALNLAFGREDPHRVVMAGIEARWQARGGPRGVAPRPRKTAGVLPARPREFEDFVASARAVAEIATSLANDEEALWTEWIARALWSPSSAGAPTGAEEAKTSVRLGLSTRLRRAAPSAAFVEQRLADGRRGVVLLLPWSGHAQRSISVEDPVDVAFLRGVAARWHFSVGSARRWPGLRGVRSSVLLALATELVDAGVLEVER